MNEDEENSNYQKKSVKDQTDGLRSVDGSGDEVFCDELQNMICEGVRIMTQYKVEFEGYEYDDVFDTYDDAEEYALYMVSCYHTGGEILEMSNPGDYPYDPDYEPEYAIIEIED